MYVNNLLRVITRLNPAVRAGIEPRSTGPRPHSMPMNQHYRPRIKSKKTARSAGGVEPTTFQTAATDNDKGWSLYRNGDQLEQLVFQSRQLTIKKSVKIFIDFGLRMFIMIKSLTHWPSTPPGDELLLNSIATWLLAWPATWRRVACYWHQSSPGDELLLTFIATWLLAWPATWRRVACYWHQSSPSGELLLASNATCGELLLASITTWRQVVTDLRRHLAVSCYWHR